MSDIVLECDTKIQNNLNNNEIKSNNLKSQEEKKKKLKLLTKEIIKETKCNIFKEWLISIQTELHKYPEIAYKEYKTSLIIKRILLSLSVSFTYGWGNQLKENNYNIYNNNNNNNNEKEESLLLFKPYEGCLIQYKEEEKILKEEGCLPYGTGIVADIGRGGPPFVLLRADMDGLPIQEDVYTHTYIHTHTHTRNQMICASWNGTVKTKTQAHTHTHKHTHTQMVIAMTIWYHTHTHTHTHAIK
eukprot:GHVR01175217.1.p1 GENE.GHVR01175217.1~~GHVR01175217.1.p1  ORF type:complete len:244 (+),score=131.02 GHVR01175217.1:56-787(+)